MSLEGASNNRLSTDPLTQIGGAGQVKPVSGDPKEIGSGKNSEIPGNGATVTGSGKPEAASGQALLGMMSNPNGMVPVSGFSNGKTERKLIVENEPTIKTHTAAFLADGAEAHKQFQKLMERASRGAESSSGKVSPREIELGRQAVMMPLDGPDAQLGAVLRDAFSLPDRVRPTLQESVDLFHSGKE
jgi:hypothetical protein